MEDLTINEQIINLLMKQTYAERIEMAETFRDYMNDWLADKNGERQTDYQTIDRDAIAFMFEAYTESMDDGKAGVHG